MCAPADTPADASPLQRLVRAIRSGVAFAAIARFAVTWPALVITLYFVLAALAAALAVNQLRVDTDPDLMISSELDFKRDNRNFIRTFPAADSNFVFVIDAEIPEQGKAAAERLAAKLRARPNLFDHILAPGVGKFFEDHGVLYASEDEVKELAEGVAKAGQMLQGLAAQPNLAGLSSLLNEVTAYTEAGRPPDGFSKFLDMAAETVEAETRGESKPLDWLRINDSEPEITETRWFVLTKPVLDFSQLEAAAAPMQAARELLDDPDIVAGTDVTIRLTGDAAMDAEEFEAVTKGAAIAGLISFIVVSLTMFFGMPALRLVIPAIALIVLGFVINAGFATVTVGYLNMISVAFAVLFIGLGVDYAVHVILRHAEERARGLSRADAAVTAVRKMGPALALCTLTTSLAFLAFVPTDFVGMAQLGIIASGGMVIAFVCSITLIPAILAVLPDNQDKIRRKLRSVREISIAGADAERSTVRMAATVAVLLLAVAALFAFPQARFDGDPVNLKDPAAPSVRTFLDIASEDAGVTYTANLLVEAGPKAREMADRFKALPLVKSVTWVEDYVPDNQKPKLAELEKLRDLVPRSVNSEADIGEQARKRMLEVMSNNMQTLQKSADASDELKASARRLDDAITAFEAKSGDNADAVRKLEIALFKQLPALLADVNALAATGPVTVASLDEEVRERYVAPDGRWRLEIEPLGNMRDEGRLQSFVEQLRSVSQDVTGSPVAVRGSADAVATSMILATLAAFALVILIVGSALRKVRDVALVLAPMILAACLMVAYTVYFDAPFNFANVIVLPLLLGLGVDSSIHYVMRAREGNGGTDVTSTSTPRAVLISAFTTIGSFGTLWLSAHRGMASMGELLTVSIIITLLCTLVVLPQLIQWAYKNGR